jgi:hypothetical protein
MNNPYPKTVRDEVSGIEVRYEPHRFWQEGYEAGLKEVGEWLVRKIITRLIGGVSLYYLFQVDAESFEALKRGEMPK